MRRGVTVGRGGMSCPGRRVCVGGCALPGTATGSMVVRGCVLVEARRGGAGEQHEWRRSNTRYKCPRLNHLISGLVIPVMAAEELGVFFSSSLPYGVACSAGRAS